jgi:beta-mannosidase
MFTKSIPLGGRPFSSMERDFRVPDGFEDYIYVSQLLQARGIKTAIEAHRRARPYCMGTLYWQLNDSWPVTSWSSVDYYGRWKALQYAVKEAYRMCLVSFEENENGVDIFVVTDDYNDKNVKLRWRLQDFNGKIMSADSNSFSLPALASMKGGHLSLNRLPAGEKQKSTVLVAELWYGSNMLYRGLYYFKKPKDLALQKASIETSLEKTDGGYFVHLKTNKLAKNIFLYSAEDVHFEENFFDLLPGEEKVVPLKTNTTHLTEKSIRVKSLFDTAEYP